jgi:acyl-CoA dehydrogenase
VLHEQTMTGDTSLGLAVHSGIVTGYLVAYGTEEQKRRWLPGLCSGDLIGAIAMTEPDGGSDLQAMRTRAIRDEHGDHRLTGAKTFISNGGLADLVIVAAKTDPEQRAAGISLLLCATTGVTAGFRRGRLLSKLGLLGNDTAELFFDGAQAEVLGGTEGRGFAQLMSQLAQERLVIGVGAVAAMERALRLTVAYTKELIARAL